MSDIGVNWLRKMSGKKLKAYISNIESAYIKEDNPINKQLFKKWLDSALEEQHFREERKLKYLKKRGII